VSDFEEKLNAILSNPDAMSQVMNLAQSLNLGGGGESSSAQQEDSPGPQSGGEAQSGGGSGLGDLTGLGSLLGQIDPAMIQRMLPLVGELTGGGNDERMQLLYALRPFLKPERRDKVERAAKTAKLIHIGKKLLSTMGESNV
jgi:hypothetical protein